MPPLSAHGLIERRPLDRLPSRRADQCLHPLWRHFLAVRGAGGARDGLVHERTAEIVDAGAQASGNALWAQLHPGGLYARDMPMERETRHGVHEHGLAEGGSAARATLEIDRRLHVDEGQRDELGEAARSRLMLAHVQQVSRPVLGPIDVPKHDRGRALEALGVRGRHHVEPLRGVDLVGADYTPDLVVQNFRRGARKRTETGFAQHREEIRHVYAEGLGALPDLERGEGMDVDPRRRFLDRAADLHVGSTRVIRMNAALQADFGGTARPGLAGAALDFGEIEIVGAPAQVLAELPLGEGAELAAEIADVGVVYVAVDYVCDDVAVDGGAQLVRGGAD